MNSESDSDYTYDYSSDGATLVSDGECDSDYEFDYSSDVGILQTKFKLPDDSIPCEPKIRLS